MITMDFPRLLAPVDARGVTFASQLQPTATISHVKSYPCTRFETLWNAICQHRFGQGQEAPQSCAICIVDLVARDRWVSL